jgi:hypothetical protein
MPDSSEIDNALIALLGGDATLLGFMPNGVYWEVAPPGSTRFVIVSLVEETDARRLGSRAHEDALYMVKAVALSTANANMKSAAARIDTVLEGATLTPTGYTHMAVYREARIRNTEVDEVDPAIRWYHRGGHYRVVMSL